MNAHDAHGRTPLHVATFARQREAGDEPLRLKALIDAGANLQLADRDGQTSLPLARSRVYAEMVKLL